MANLKIASNALTWSYWGLLPQFTKEHVKPKGLLGKRCCMKADKGKGRRPWDVKSGTRWNKTENAQLHTNHTTSAQICSVWAHHLRIVCQWFHHQPAQKPSVNKLLTPRQSTKPESVQVSCRCLPMNGLVENDQIFILQWSTERRRRDLEQIDESNLGCSMYHFDRKKMICSQV